MDGQRAGFRALKAWEKDGMWGVAASEDLVTKRPFHTYAAAMQSIDDFYALGGKTEAQHSDEFQNFFDGRKLQWDARKQKAKEIEHANPRGPGSKISKSEQADADTSEQEKAMRQMKAQEAQQRIAQHEAAAPQAAQAAANVLRQMQQAEQNDKADRRIVQQRETAGIVAPV
jgi:hypothetical protein